MKILMISGSSPPIRCGVGDYTFRLCHQLSLEHDTTLLTSHGADSVHQKQLEVKPIMNWSPKAIFAFLRILRQIKPDIVHIQYPAHGYTGLLAYLIPAIAFVMRIKVVQTWHEFIRLDASKISYLFNWVPSGLVYVRPNFIEQSSPIIRFLIKLKLSKFIPNASVIPRSKLNNEQRSALRSKLLNNQKRLISFFGFISEHKGVLRLFDIADPSRDQLLIIGHLDLNDPYHKAVADRSNKSDWRGQVHFSGFLGNAICADYISCSDVAVFPSKEGMGEWNTSLHAAAKNNCPVLGTTNKEASLKNQTKLVPLKDDLALKNGLDEMIRCYPFENRDFDKSAVSDEWQEIADKHTNLYRTLLGELKK